MISNLKLAAAAGDDRVAILFGIVLDREYKTSC